MHAIVLTRLISKAEKVAPRYSVVSHPQGGWAIGERRPGSTVLTYIDSHASKSVLEARADTMNARALREIMTLNSAASAAQMSLGLELPSRSYGRAA